MEIHYLYNISNSLDVILALHANSIIKLPCLSIAVAMQTCSFEIPLFLTCLSLLRECLGMLEGFVPLKLSAKNTSSACETKTRISYKVDSICSF